jgi:hypothetical protein
MNSMISKGPNAIPSAPFASLAHDISTSLRVCWCTYNLHCPASCSRKCAAYPLPCIRYVIDCVLFAHGCSVVCVHLMVVRAVSSYSWSHSSVPWWCPFGVPRRVLHPPAAYFGYTWSKATNFAILCCLYIVNKRVEKSLVVPEGTQGIYLPRVFIYVLPTLL